MIKIISAMSLIVNNWRWTPSKNDFKRSVEKSQLVLSFGRAIDYVMKKKICVRCMVLNFTTWLVIDIKK